MDVLLVICFFSNFVFNIVIVDADVADEGGLIFVLLFVLVVIEPVEVFNFADYLVYLLLLIGVLTFLLVIFLVLVC